jgi:hypothetical protein
MAMIEAQEIARQVRMLIELVNIDLDDRIGDMIGDSESERIKQLLMQLSYDVLLLKMRIAETADYLNEIPYDR